MALVVAVSGAAGGCRQHNESGDHASPVGRHNPPISLDLGAILKLLLTSGGVTNPSIADALVDLLGTPSARPPRFASPLRNGATLCAVRCRRGASSAACPRGVA